MTKNSSAVFTQFFFTEILRKYGMGWIRDATLGNNYPGSAGQKVEKAEKLGRFYSRSKLRAKNMKEEITEECRTASIAIYEEEKDTVELASYPGTVSRFLGSKRFPSKAIKDTPLKKFKVFLLEQ